MQSIHQLLNQYWQHDNFRPFQEEIITAALNGEDTLALLPTGGGKSLCFQITSLAQEGICIVISPLIALMKDQVDGLKKKGIKAISITSDMKKREIDIAFDNCVYGNVKFLYLSPERLETEIAKVRLQKMNINLIAVDEAHCISQWGYDFRPSYLKLQELRELLPKVPVLALTATATPRVVRDIQKKLLFKKEHVIQQSFERANLKYVVLYEEDKLKRLLTIAKKLDSSGVIYARNRKRTQEIAAYLQANNISADFYHAGLNTLLRSKKQNDWMINKTRVIVCTNAFGMGIDKPDVGFVAHADVPESLESYFQEAGRAGRNGENAYAILLYTKTDAVELERNINNSFPPLETIRKVYQCLANFYQLAIGSGFATTFSFDSAAFCNNYNLDPLTVFNALKIIAREGYISFSEGFYQPARVKIELDKESLYHFQLQAPQYDYFIKSLLRAYTNLFDNFSKINEYDIAKHLKVSRENVVKKLKVLEQHKVISYLPETELPHITFEMERVDAKKLKLSKENYTTLKERSLERMDAIIHYASSTHKCRSQLLLAYFGEKETTRCGNCDVCLQDNSKRLSPKEFSAIQQDIRKLLSEQPLSLHELSERISEKSNAKCIKTIQWMLDNDELCYTSKKLLCLVKK